MLALIQDGLTLLIKLSGLMGLTIDLIGTLYLAYDLFGQRHGPLRTLTEVLTYIVLAMFFGTTALGVIAFDAVQFDPYFTQSVSIPGAISVLLSWGAAAGLGAGCSYALTIERKWNAGNPRIVRNNPTVRILSGLLLGIFQGLEVYIVMANFRHAHDVKTGLIWGSIQGVPAGLLFGWLVGLLLVRFSQQWQTEKLTDAESIRSVTQALPTRPLDIWGLVSGVAVGFGVGPVTAMSYFALYGTFVVPTFGLISLAGIIGGVGIGLILLTVERTLLWVDLLPPKRLGIAGAFLIFIGFLFQASQQVASLLQALLK